MESFQQVLSISVSIFGCSLLFQSNSILPVEFCPKVFRNYHLKAGRRDFRGRGLYSVTKQGLKSWQQCSLAVSAQDQFLNRWQPLWKIQVQFLMIMRSRLGMRLGAEYPASLQKTAVFTLNLSRSCCFPKLYLFCAAEGPWWAAVV